MEEKIVKILEEINEDILNYKGDNLYEDGLLDSFQVIELVTQIEEVFNIEILPEFIIFENFANKDSIVQMVKKIMKEADYE